MAFEIESKAEALPYEKTKKRPGKLGRYKSTGAKHLDDLKRIET